MAHPHRANRFTNECAAARRASVRGKGQVDMGFTKALQTEWTGWLAASMIGVQIAIPFLVRRAKQARSVRSAMRWHYLLGFVLPAAVLWHGWIPMASRHMPRTSITGLWLATIALGLLFLQVLLGLAVQRLSDGGSVARPSLRRIHFAAMLAIAALAISHMLLN